MTPAVREQLLGYLLGALDEVEMAEVRRQLEDNLEWRLELEELQTQLTPLEFAADDVDPPADLAERTCAFVDDCAPVTPAGPRFEDGLHGAGAARSRASLSDIVVVAGILLAGGLLFFPVISNSRHLARRNICQNNLRQIGIALLDYSDKAGRGYFPCPPPLGNRAFAGIYGPVLYEGGYLLRSAALVCPSSPLADRGVPFQIPQLRDVDRARAYELVALQRVAGGSYLYNLGVVVNGRHYPPKNQGRTYFVLAGDSAGVVSRRLRPIAHGSGGQNLLFENGEVRFLAGSAQTTRRDNPFVNSAGVVEAGIGPEDSVIAPSDTPPFVRTLVQAR